MTGVLSGEPRNSRVKKRQTWQASSRSMSINRLHPSLCIDGIPHADQLRRNSTADKPTAKCQFYHDSVRSSRDQVRRYFGCAGFGCVAFSWNWGMLTRMLACLLACLLGHIQPIREMLGSRITGCCYNLCKPDVFSNGSCLFLCSCSWRLSSL